MANRLILHNALKSILNNVYYQPPATVRLTYPCIVYTRKNIVGRNADNFKYKKDVAYTVTLIDRAPDSEYLMPIYELEKCSHNRHFTNDNLHHDEFTIYS